MILSQRLILASALLSSLLAAGCGGDGSAIEVAEQARTSSHSAMPASVRLEGCVVTSDWMAVPSTAVHLRTADGRVVGTVLTDARGVFVATVPARSDIALAMAVAGPSEMTLRTGSGPLSLGACLLTDL